MRLQKTQKTPGVLRAPVRARGQRTRERILAASEHLLRRKRLEDLTIRDIVEAAEVSVGSFYHLFGARDAIVAPLYARYDARVTAGAARALNPARWRGRSLGHRASRIVRYGVRLYRIEGGLIRALALHARGHGQPVTSDQHDHRAALYDQLAALLLECRDEITHPDPEAAVRLGLFFVAAACRDKILFGDAPHPRSITCDDRALAVELTRALLGYLTAHTS